FFFTDMPTTEIYTLSLHDALPISFRAHPGSRWLGKFGLQKLLGYHLTRRQQPHLSEHAVELALCRIAVRLAVEKLFESLLGSFQDRKSTRLNSSHRTISYAVFCLK